MEDTIDSHRDLAVEWAILNNAEPCEMRLDAIMAELTPETLALLIKIAREREEAR